MIVNVTVFVVRVWGGQYREELIVSALRISIKNPVTSLVFCIQKVPD